MDFFLFHFVFVLCAVHISCRSTQHDEKSNFKHQHYIQSLLNCTNKHQQKKKNSKQNHLWAHTQWTLYHWISLYSPERASTLQWNRIMLQQSFNLQQKNGYMAFYVPYNNMKYCYKNCNRATDFRIVCCCNDQHYIPNDTG